jgi:hypothetical protein
VTQEVSEGHPPTSLSGDAPGGSASPGALVVTGTWHRHGATVALSEGIASKGAGGALSAFLTHDKRTVDWLRSLSQSQEITVPATSKRDDSIASQMFGTGGSGGAIREQMFGSGSSSDSILQAMFGR